MFAPCNIPLHTMVERAEVEMARGKDRRRTALQRGKMDPDQAAYYDRWDRAVVEMARKLKAIEDKHPEILESVA